ncbi:MAG: hypothetical protein AAGJ18_15295 [Bacteroidota bacterium]
MMKYKHFVCWVVLVLVAPTFLLGQNAFAHYAGARGIGLANANLGFRDVYAGFNNQAGLAFLEHFGAVGYVENRFQLDELKLAAVTVAKPTELGTFGMTLQYYGFDLYNEQKVGLNYSRKLFDNLAIGAQFDFLNTRISEYGNASALTFELGLQYRIIEKLWAGVHVFNPIRAELGQTALPALLQIGLNYEVSTALIISASIEKNAELATNYRIGLEYFLWQKVFFRTGINTEPSLLNFGLGYDVGQVQINVAASFHQVLGISPAIGLRFTGKD